MAEGGAEYMDEFMRFVGLGPFKADNLTRNFDELLKATGLVTEDQVDNVISGFWANGEYTKVGKGKRKSALFILYLAWLNSDPAVFKGGVEFGVNKLGRELTIKYFGETIIGDPENHLVPAALLAEWARIKIERSNLATT